MRGEPRYKNSERTYETRELKVLECNNCTVHEVAHFVYVLAVLIFRVSSHESQWAIPGPNFKTPFCYNFEVVLPPIIR